MGAEKVLMSLEALFQLIVIIAFFVGPNNDNEIYIFDVPQFQTKQACAQFVRNNQYYLNVYLSEKYDTLPTIYSNNFYCTNAKNIEEWQKNKGSLI